MKKNLAVITKYFPSKGDPTSGTFVYDQANRLSEYYSKTDIYVLLPIVKISRRPPYVTYDQSLFELYSIEKSNVDLHKVFYFPFPKNSALHALAIACSMRRLKGRVSGATVLAHTIYPVGVALTILGYINVNIICHGSDYRSFYRLKNLTKKISNVLMNQKVAFVSKGLFLDVQSHQDSTEKCIIINNGIKINTCRIKRLPKAPPFKLLYAGALIEQKGIINLLKAVTLIQHDNPGFVELTIVGSGPLFEKAKNYENQYIQVHQSVSNKILIDKMSDYHALILPSYKEAFGRVLIEMMSCGRPVIAARSGGPEFIVTPEVGLVMPTNSIQDIRQHILELFTNYKRYDPVQIKKYVSLNFNEDDKTEELLNWIEDENFTYFSD